TPAFYCSFLGLPIPLAVERLGKVFSEERDNPPMTNIEKRAGDRGDNEGCLRTEAPEFDLTHFGMLSHRRCPAAFQAGECARLRTGATLVERRLLWASGLTDS
ncbi:MAG: hypothetical protein ACE5IJ_09550, partial [Thermoplasmata archaeon]